MGQMVDGEWRTGWYEPNAAGAFERPKTCFRSWVTKDGSSGFLAEPGRYHLYAAYACPWAQRALITRTMRGLEDVIPVTIVGPRMGDDGWCFDDDRDPIFDARLLQEIYLHADPRYTGRVTVPVLWDKKKQTIVNNESREVMRMLDTVFDEFARDPRTLAPPDLIERIDHVLDAIYEPINNGVYKAGFATKQGAYDEAVQALFSALDHWNAVLADQRFVCGDRLTEADIALFTTLLRFDLVYYGHFKCNVRRLQDYEHLWGFVRDIYQMPAVKKATNLEHIKVHYYWSQTTVNPYRIIPRGPTIDFDAPHKRARVGLRLARTAESRL